MSILWTDVIANIYSFDYSVRKKVIRYGRSSAPSNIASCLLICCWLSTSLVQEMVPCASNYINLFEYCPVIGNSLSRNPSRGQVVARVNILTSEG